MANYANIQRFGDPSTEEWQRNNLVTVKAPNGQSWQVHRDAAKSFEGLFGDLVAAGYSPTSSGGFNYRTMRGSNKLSQHAFGNAIDMNAATNPMLSRGARVVTDLPANTAELAAKHNIEWGGTWKRPDAMHFEWRGPLTGQPAPALVAGNAGSVGGVPAQVVETTPVQPTLGDYVANAQAQQFNPQAVAGNAMANFIQARSEQQRAKVDQEAADMERRRALFGDLGSFYA